MVTNLHAKNQVNICKHLEKKVQKINTAERQTDELTDGQSANLKSSLALPVGD